MCGELNYGVGEGGSFVVIGEGSGGVVYKALYKGQLVAVKTMHNSAVTKLTRATARGGGPHGGHAPAAHAPAIDHDRQVKLEINILECISSHANPRIFRIPRPSLRLSFGSNTFSIYLALRDPPLDGAQRTVESLASGILALQVFSTLSVFPTFLIFFISF